MRRILLLAAATFSFWGCSKDDADYSYGGSDPVGYDPARVVCITANSVTRGTPVGDVSDMTDMGVYCSSTGTVNWNENNVSHVPNHMLNERLVRNSSTGVWEYENTPVEWAANTSDDRYTFFAYAPFGTGIYNSSSNDEGNGIVVNGSASTPGIPTLTYTVPADVTKQPDLMVAVPRKDIRPLGNPVNLQMEHALTCVGFQVSGEGEKVTGISISGVRMKGTLAMDGGTVTWSSLGAVDTSTDLSASINCDAGENYYTTTPAMSTNLLKGDGYLMMIPQTLGTDAKLTVTLDGNETREIPLNTHVWQPGKRITYNITIKPGGTVVVTPSDLMLDALAVDGTSNNLQVECFKGDGTPNPSLPWTLASAGSWLKLSTTQGGPGTISVSGTGSQTVYTFASKNISTTTIRSAAIYLDGNDSNIVANIMQLYTFKFSTYASEQIKNTYHGAFWRADQTGERLIKLSLPSTHAGKWEVIILDCEDFATGDIVLSTDPSKDGTVLQNTDPQINMNDPANDTFYSVDGDATSLSGTIPDGGGDILFRIGLKTKWDASNPKYNASKPARYTAIVLLYTYNGNTKYQKIFLRQGHEADHLMRNNNIEDAYDNGILRTESRQFSPYNLTAPEFKLDPNGTGGDNVTDHPVIPARGSMLVGRTADDYFTDFPTQTGAYFQWADYDNPRRAYHPTNPVGKITGWTYKNSPTTFWDNLKDGNETCPPGWRRPNDGPIDDAVPSPASADSEMRQSLWTVLPTGSTSQSTDKANAALGYLADGFFDRGAIGPSIVGMADIAVGSGANTAYTGTLMYNPNTNASLFFPSSHNRVYINGTLYDTTMSGSYWSSSSENDIKSWRLIFSRSNPGFAYMSPYERATGYSIRCVKE